MSNTAYYRKCMIDGQLTPGEVLSEPVLQAISDVPRELFVSEALAGAAYVDEDIPLGHGRYLMEPRVLCRFFDLISGHPVETMMIIGGTTGYSAAVASGFVPKVVMIEEWRDLAETARKNINQLGIETVEVISAPLSNGCAAQAPYDVIWIEGAVEELPETLFEQLAPEGELFTVECINPRPGSELGLGQAVVYRVVNGQKDKQVLFDASVALLPDFKKSETFSL